ncbi:hypothetical protein [Psychrobacter sp. 1044]|uniref:hypothetical protein n=1 Tax=Psychrobacter sp. 1044 TaxID=2772562 RepID=UPI00191956A0|nr:hypothetical protein [Psychrobacter sp. 1044]
MALLSPETVPVKMYKWDDVGAPELKKTAANGAAEIFKACLVVGYGAKPSAGWTMPFEASGVKVFRPQIGAETDFYLRMASDNGRQVDARIYQNMTNANTGNLKLNCAQRFKYTQGFSSGKWLLVASPRSVWFFCEQGFFLDTSDLLSKSGAFFFAGDTMRNSIGVRAVFLQHTGGSYNDGDYRDIFGYNRYGEVDKIPESYIAGKLLDSTGVVYNAELESFFDGHTARTQDRILSPLLTFAGNNAYQIPGLTVVSNGATRDNFTTQNIDMGDYVSDIMTFSTNPSLATNFCVATDKWSY